MPVDYQQVHARIKEIGAGARERRKTLDERRKKARDLLLANSDKLDFLRAKVDSAKAVDVNIRCALPVNESLASHFPITDPANDANSYRRRRLADQSRSSRGSPVLFDQCRRNCDEVELRSIARNFYQH